MLGRGRTLEDAVVLFAHADYDSVVVVEEHGYGYEHAEADCGSKARSARSSYMGEVAKERAC